MKTLLVMLLISTTVLFANDIELESAIFNKVLTAVTAKERPKVYIYQHNDSLEKYPGKLQLVKDCKDADIVLVSTLKNLPKECEGKILFATRYSHLLNPNVIGAFFWQKGRPNILFYKYRLEEKNIQLDKSFEKYIE